MTFVKPNNSLLSCRFASRLLAAAIFPALSACGGSDLACGAGTVQNGDQCVAKGAVTVPLADIDRVRLVPKIEWRKSR